MKKYSLILATILTAFSVMFFSCGKESTAENSKLHIRLTDAPTNYDEVNVDIREVRVKFSEDSTSNGWISLTTHAGIYNLLDYQNGVDTLLATGLFPTQVLKEIRFILGPDNSIMDAGIVYPLTIPSGSESGLKIKIKKSLQETLETIVIDFDAALSVHKTGNGEYKLKPVLKIK